MLLLKWAYFVQHLNQDIYFSPNEFFFFLHYWYLVIWVKSKWLQVSSGLQDTSQYSSRLIQRWGLDDLHFLKFSDKVQVFVHFFRFLRFDSVNNQNGKIYYTTGSSFLVNQN